MRLIPADGAAETESPLAYLLSIMRDPAADPARRDRAAIAALPYCHARADVAGKRAAAEALAADAERGTVWEKLLA